MSKRVTKAAAPAPEPDPKNDQCPRCGYCEHCGQSRAVFPVPYVYPHQVAPYRPWQTYPYWVTNTAAANTISYTYSVNTAV